MYNNQVAHTIMVLYSLPSKYFKFGQTGCKQFKVISKVKIGKNIKFGPYVGDHVDTKKTKDENLYWKVSND